MTGAEGLNGTSCAGALQQRGRVRKSLKNTANWCPIQSLFHPATFGESVRICHNDWLNRSSRRIRLKSADQADFGSRRAQLMTFDEQHPKAFIHFTTPDGF